MKKELPIHTFQIKMPPFFRNGVLVFESSGHYLVVSDRNYRCNLDCRGKCGKNEKQFKKENIERNFSRYAQKFVCENTPEMQKFTTGLMKDLMHGIIDSDHWEEQIRKGDILEDTVEMMKSDFDKSGKISEEDIKEFQNLYAEANTVSPRLILSCMAIGMLKSLSESENEVRMARDLSMLCKKIYITDTGKIHSILFERWGWYTLNFIDRHVQNYLKDIVGKKVKILNDNRDEILKLDLKEAVTHFTKENLDDALHCFSIKYFYDLFSTMRVFIDPIIQGKSTPEQGKEFIKGLEKMMHPMMQMETTIMQMTNLKVRRKAERKKERGENAGV